MKAVEFLEGSRIRFGFYSKPWLPPHMKGRKSVDHTSTSKKLPIADTLNHVIVRMALKCERHDSRRTRKGKSTR